jgi:prephenate dehydratase
VGATEDGTEVEVRDVRDSAENETRFAVAVRVLLDRNGRMTTQEIVWASRVLLK